MKFAISAFIAVILLALLPSCIVVPQSEDDDWYSPFTNLADFSGTSDYFTETPDYERVSLPFRKGDMLDWDTGASNGVMKVVYTNDSKFRLEQYNRLNKKAGDVLMEGEMFPDGTFRIENSSWREVWVGNLHNNSIVGKVNDVYNFRITWKIPHYFSTIKPVSRFPFARADTIKWQLGSGHGYMKVVSVKDNKFSVDRYDDFNKKAKPVRMEGEIDSKGVCKIKNPSGKEEWRGKLAGNIISGKANNGRNFKIARSTSVWDMPFKQGDSLKWSSVGQKGTMKVVSIPTGGKFVVDVYKGNNKYIKENRLNGEILADGTYKFTNTSGSSKIWIGSRDGSEISGKINNKDKFKIEGLR